MFYITGFVIDILDFIRLNSLNLGIRKLLIKANQPMTNYFFLMMVVV